MNLEATNPDELAREHRRLDDLFGRFLGAAQAGDAGSAREAIREFDDALRHHTAVEERGILAPPGGHKLAPPETETAANGSTASCVSSTCRSASFRR